MIEISWQQHDVAMIMVAVGSVKQGRKEGASWATAYLPLGGKYHLRGELAGLGAGHLSALWGRG
jgi:hypothetical protein